MEALHIPPISTWLNLPRYCFSIAESGRIRGHLLDTCGIDRARHRRDRAPARPHRLGSDPEQANRRHRQSRRIRCHARRRRAHTYSGHLGVGPKPHHLDIDFPSVDQHLNDYRPKNDDDNHGGAYQHNHNTTTVAASDDVTRSGTDTVDRNRDRALRATRTCTCTCTCT